MILINEKGIASLNTVIKMVEDFIIKKNSPLPLPVAISAGNYDTSRYGYTKDHPVVTGKEEDQS